MTLIIDSTNLIVFWLEGVDVPMNEKAGLVIFFLFLCLAACPSNYPIKESDYRIKDSDCWVKDGAAYSSSKYNMVNFSEAFHRGDFNKLKQMLYKGDVRQLRRSRPCMLILEDKDVVLVNILQVGEVWTLMFDVHCTIWEKAIQDHNRQRELKRCKRECDRRKKNYFLLDIEECYKECLE